jgi:hypothetical protein
VQLEGAQLVGVLLLLLLSLLFLLLLLLRQHARASDGAA